MTKSELINAVHAAAENKGIEISKKAVGEVADDIFDIMSQEIQASGRQSIPGFGTFTKEHKKARQGRNPRTGAALTIAARNVVKFKPAPPLKERVN